MLRGPALTAIALLLAVLNGSAVDAAVWRVPLKRHSTVATHAAAVSYLHGDALASWPLNKKESTIQNGKHTSVWTPSFPDDVSRVPEDFDFTNFDGVFYAAEIMFGTPPQPISLCLDLGSTDNLVINHKVGTHAYYDHAKSSTYQANGTRVSLYEGTPSAVQGFVSTDQVTIPAGGGGLPVKGMSFVELESPDSFLESLPDHFDGTIGLGARTQNSTGTPSIMRSMITQGLLDKPVVGVHVNKKTAHLTFGGVDAHYKESDITYFTDTREERGGWWLPPIGVQVNGERIAVPEGDRTIVFEALQLIAGPPDAVEKLAELVGAVNHAIPCDTPGPDITITAGAFALTLTKADYAIPKGDWCLFAFFSVPTVTRWILGKPFVDLVYLVLDYGKTESDARLGLAHLKPE